MIDLAELRDENRSAVRRWHEAALHDLELAELLAERGFYPRLFLRPADGREGA